jgi:hypothetical protein
MNRSSTQWYNENEGRQYPLASTATQISDAGIPLPTDILADLAVMVPTLYTGVRIGSLRLTANMVTVSIVSDQGGLLIGTHLLQTTEPYRAYPLTALQTNCSGWVVYGNHPTQTVEDYRFATALQSALEQRAIRYCDPPLVSDIVRKGNTTDQAATGVIRLTAGTGVTITRDPVDPHNIIVRLNPDMKAKLSGPCNQNASSLPPIRRLNGVAADETGTITLRFV